jgi:excisionase family DNA binding protein
MQIKLQPLNELKEKGFLSINETSTLLGISRRTLYRMISRNELKTFKAGTRTIIKRTEIDNLFQ